MTRNLRAGGRGGRLKGFASEMAAKTGKSKRQINRLTAEPKAKSVEKISAKDEPASIKEPGPKEYYHASLSHEPKLETQTETQTELDAIRHCYIGRLDQLDVDARKASLELLVSEIPELSITGIGADDIGNIPPFLERRVMIGPGVEAAQEAFHPRAAQALQGRAGGRAQRGRGVECGRALR